MPSTPVHSLQRYTVRIPVPGIPTRTRLFSLTVARLSSLSRAFKKKGIHGRAAPLQMQKTRSRRCLSLATNIKPRRPARRPARPRPAARSRGLVEIPSQWGDDLRRRAVRTSSR